jgi:hypothetical protein
MAESKPYDHTFQFKDIPTVAETFADGVHLVTVDGTTTRIVFTASRADPPKTGNKSPTGQKAVAARLVLTNPAMAALYNQLSKMVQVLEQRGLMKREGGEAQTIQ